jgi:hypothetical protein
MMILVDIDKVVSTEAKIRPTSNLLNLNNLVLQYYVGEIFIIIKRKYMSKIINYLSTFLCYTYYKHMLRKSHRLIEHIKFYFL